MRPTRKQARVILAVLLALILLPLLALADVPRDAVRHQRDLTRNARAVWGMDAPVAVFAAQIHQESRWRADAQSPVGAQGMAQFMPATAAWISGVYRWGEAQPANPAWAMRALVTYDRWLRDRVQAADACSRMAMSLSAYNGKQGVIVIDEAAFHADLGQLLKAAMAMLLWGDKVRIISTHDGQDNEFNELIQEVRAGKRKGSVHRFIFRDAVAQGLYGRVCLRRGIEWTAEGEARWVADAYAFYGDDAAEELDVVPSQSGGVYLTMGLIEARMNPDTPLVRGRWTSEFAYLPDWEREAEVAEWCEENLKDTLNGLNKDLAHGFGEDFGRTGDLTIIDIMEEGRDLITRVRGQIELSNCPFRQQEQILIYIVSRLPRFRSGALDARGNGQYLAERAAQKFGLARIGLVMLSDSFYLANMPRFKAALQDGTLDDIPKDSQVRDDLRALRVIDGTPKLPKTKTQKGDGPQLQRHGDSAISLFLGHYAMKREVTPIEFQSAGQRVAASGGMAGFM